MATRRVRRLFVFVFLLSLAIILIYELVFPRVGLPALDPRRAGAAMVLSKLNSPKYQDSRQRITALGELKSEMGAANFGAALLSLPTDAILASMSESSGSRASLPASRHGHRIGLAAAASAPMMTDNGAAGMWVLSQKSIAVAQQSALSEQGKRLAMAAYEDELGPELFQIVIESVPVTDPQTNKVFTLEQYGQLTVKRAGAALEQEAAQVIDVQAVGNFVAYLDENEVPWEETLISMSVGQSPGEVLAPWAADRALTWACEEANAELGLTERDVSMIVATAKLSVGVFGHHPALAVHASIELASLAEEDLQAPDSRLRPVADWALSNPNVRQAAERLDVGQHLSARDMDYLRKGVGNAQLWLDGSPDAWVASAELALEISGAEVPGGFSTWVSAVEGDLDAAIYLVGEIDVDMRGVELYVRDTAELFTDGLLSDLDLGGFVDDLPIDLGGLGLDDLDFGTLDFDDLGLDDIGVDLSDLDIPDLDIPDLDLPDLELPDFDLPDLDLPDLDLPDLDIPDFELPDLGDFDLPSLW